MTDDFFSGGRFYSVVDDWVKTGYFHILQNLSPHAIFLKVDAKQE
jgi:hypothetical protein